LIDLNQSQNSFETHCGIAPIIFTFITLKTIPAQFTKV